MRAPTPTSVGEACIIQSIINAADAELDGISINTLPTDWGNYYDQIKAAYAGGTPPDVHVMHRHRMPNSRASARWPTSRATWKPPGIDPSDWAPAALDAVSYNGGIYGVPMDFHANLWHVNMEIMEEAGLVATMASRPAVSPEELWNTPDGQGRDRAGLPRRRFRAVPDRCALWCSR
jgi:multiple sugar transport system substrate-binding protein